MPGRFPLREGELGDLLTKRPERANFSLRIWPYSDTIQIPTFVTQF